MRDFTTTELAQLAADFEGWTWTQSAIEPDGRIDVLVDTRGIQDVKPFLVRHRDGWFWVTDTDDFKAIVESHTPFSWRESITDLAEGEAMRMPTPEELEQGGWTIIDTDGQETAAVEPKDEAKEQLDRGLGLLLKPGVDMRDLARSETHLIASIAISLHELVALHKKYDVDSFRVEVDPGPDQAQEVRSAAGNPEQEVQKPKGPFGGEDFPFAR